MGTFNTESDQTSPIMESEKKTITNGNLKTNSPSKLSSSFSSTSSSPESMLENPFQDNDEPDNSTISTTAMPKAVSTLPLANASCYNTPNASSDNMSTEFPPTQVIESRTNSSYRIPSSVFARTKSTAPADWSTASNESLFSIHMGNMSFTGDNFFLRSGELGTTPAGDQATTSGPLFNFPVTQSPVGKSNDSTKSRELGVAKVAVETMKEVLKENAEAQNNKSFLAEGNISHHSGESGTSTKSFAFPILTANTNNSARLGSQKQQPQSQPKLQSPVEPKPEPEPEPKSTAATPDVAGARWFICLPCCSSWTCFSCCS